MNCPLHFKRIKRGISVKFNNLSEIKETVMNKDKYPKGNDHLPQSQEVVTGQK